MGSDESDDEPLSVLAAAKKENPEKFMEKPVIPEYEFTYAPKRKRRKVSKNTREARFKKLPLTFKLSTKLKNSLTTVIQRPSDVWLYLKDLHLTGPYSCLLCPEWFVNRAKIIIHYVLNHKKDFCGICRYFVPERNLWNEHLKFHSPWPCSQCVENFTTDTELRHHLSHAHKLVHCRLCHFRMPDNDQYNTHLYQKHNVTNVSSKHEEVLWELDYEGSPTFLCLLCAKSNNLSATFFNHFMGFHHFTLKCFTNIISGRDVPFSVNGADVSAQFIASLKGRKLGYVDLDPKIEPGQENDQNYIDDKNLINCILPDIKEEVPSDTEDTRVEINIIKREKLSELVKTYKGDQDFDVTLMELIVPQKCYFDYINQTLCDINSNLVPENSDIDYEKAKSDIDADIICSLCQRKFETLHNFSTHMQKMHSVKSLSIFNCRICGTTFDSRNDLENHITEELGEFEDLWICQFCDKEFNNREASRHHLNDHWDILECDNCFSPHLGFKCKYCPILFWNETDRENHQVKIHFLKYREYYYKCNNCSEVFSDKVWFVHHHLSKHHEASQSMYLLKCCICCVVLSSVEDMRSHFASYHPEARKIFCSLGACQYRPLSHKKSFQLHLRSQHVSDVRKDVAVNCSVCSREFSNLRACNAHMSQVHGTGKFKCKICKETLQSIDERKLHYLIRHPGHHPFECVECGKSFQYKSSLYMHKQEHAPNKQSYTCPYCQKVFAKKDSFREHVQIHEGPRHACSYCPMRFVQRSNMLRHERRHTGERPYVCPHCPRTFADKGACNSHARTHSKDTSYACLYCGQTFVQKSKLTYHIRKHTGENLETCTVCSKMFTSACSLREHMKVHESKKGESVKCPLCDRKYQDERYMLRHLRTSHSFGHYACPLCKKSLTSPAGLRHHVITHSPLNAFRCKCCPKSYAVKRTMMKHLRKRHGLKGSEVNIKDFYKKLEPRECQLKLDEATMTSIFGPPKKKVTDVLISDFVTYTKSIKPSKVVTKTEDTEDNDNEERSDDDEVSEDDEKKVKTKVESEDDEEKAKESNGESEDEGGEMKSVYELEPTDFVSVKIEPMDDDDIKKE